MFYVNSAFLFFDFQRHVKGLLRAALLFMLDCVAAVRRNGGLL
jgi:hypothetical protein